MNEAGIIKQKIIAQADDMFLRYGIRSVTMDDIARELGMSKKTLYQYVDNKTDLLQQVMDAHVEQNEVDMCTIVEQASDAIDEILRMAKIVGRDLRRVGPKIMYDLRKYYRELWGKMECFHKDQIYDMIKSNLERGIEQGLYRADLNTDVIAKLYVGKILFVVDEETFPLEKYNKEELFNEYINYHIRGVASPKGLALLNQRTHTES